MILTLQVPDSPSRIKSETVAKGKGCSQNSSKSFSGSRKWSPNKVVYHEKERSWRGYQIIVQHLKHSSPLTPDAASVPSVGWALQVPGRNIFLLNSQGPCICFAYGSLQVCFPSVLNFVCGDLLHMLWLELTGTHSSGRSLLYFHLVNRGRCLKQLNLLKNISFYVMLVWVHL